MNDIPTEIRTYRPWLKDELGVEVGKYTENHYDSVARKLRDDYSASPFWKQFRGRLKDYNERYLLQTGYDLFRPPPEPEIVTKPWLSFFEKTFRLNVLENDRSPEPPPDGWLTPDNWYSRIHDIVRTRVAVRYLDGVEYLMENVTTLAEELGVPCRVDYQAREEGYYAAHINITQEIEIPRMDFDTHRVQAQLEIQVTTQLQDVIAKLLHFYYERRRLIVAPGPDALKWQWNYGSDEFVTNYLGHISHYLEGMIMQARSRTSSTDRREP